MSSDEPQRGKQQATATFGVRHCYRLAKLLAFVAVMAAVLWSLWKLR